MFVPDDHPSTDELQREQRRRELEERAQAAKTPDDTAPAHERRAEKAAYLSEKLKERAQSEQEARIEGGGGD